MLVKCIYASTSGNTETVMEKVAALFKEAGHTVELYRAEKTSIEALTSHDLFVLGTSTWEHGELNPYFAKLLAEMAKQSLAGKRAAFIGLGDTRYEPVLFCVGMEKVRQVWLTQGGAEVGTALKINGEPYHILDTTVTVWAQNLLDELK